MSIQYIFGGAGAGKTNYILNDIAVHSETDSQLIYIVPEQFSLQSEKNLISRLKNAATLNIQVLSFRRLAYYVFSETGGGEYFDDIGKTMLLRKLLLELKDQLKFFVKATDKQGFMEQLADAVSEFYRYGVTIEKLLDYAESVRNRETLYNKLCDLALIYKSYSEYVESRYISTDAMLDVLAERLSGSERIMNALCWISGFHGFTPQEYKVLDELMKHAARVTIALTVKEPSKKYFLRESDPFYEPKRTVNRLTELAINGSVVIDEPVLLNADSGCAELRYIEEHFLERASDGYAKPTERISICRADNQYSEIHQVAAEITDLARAGWSYSDMAVLTGDIHTYEREIRSIFALYDIPVFIDIKTGVLSHPLVELILAMLEVVSYNWSYESVFRFLKTDMTALTRNEVDNLENYVLAYGIKGSRWVAERWQYGFDNDSRFNEEEIHRSKEYCRVMLKPLEADRSRKRSIREFSADVFRVLDGLKIAETIQAQTDELERLGNREPARRNRQIWGKVCGVFDVLVEILGDERVGIQEFAKILEAGFKSTDMGIIPTAQIQVLAGDVERSRLPKIKALFMLGVNDGILPAVRENNTLITDDERMLLDPKAEELAPGSRRSGYEQQFLIYHALCAARERLFLSYSTGRVNGRAMRPSTLVAKLKKLYPLVQEQPPDYNTRITLARPMFSQMGAAIRDYVRAGGGDFAGGDGRSLDNEASILERVYGWFDQSPEYSARIKTINDILFEQTGDEFLSGSAADKLYGKEFSMSVSRLERYVQCPYAYFIRHNLAALERKIYEARAVELGSLYHDVLEMFSKTMELSGKSWRELVKPEIDTGVDECIAELAPRLGNEVLLSTARYKYVVRQAARVLKRSIWALAEHIKSGDFEIFATELEFGAPVMAVTLELANGRKLSLHGRIDRIDILDFDGKQYVKIIDYKSGNNKFDLDDIYFGTQLQLLLYMDAFIRSGADMTALPGGVFYFNLNDPIVDYSEKTLEQLDDEILKRFKMSGLVLADANVVKAIDSGIGRSSKIIPAALTASGEVGGSSVADVDEFDALRVQVVEKIKELGEQISSGNINILPYKKGEMTGCTYCLYGAVCRFQKDRYNTVKGH